MSRLTRLTRSRPNGAATHVDDAEPDDPAAIRTVFVANRGEIAQRIRRTAEQTGRRAIVPVTDGPGALDLLAIDQVVTAAIAAGADAVHPGFGFLAENADFAEAVIAAGLRGSGRRRARSGRWATRRRPGDSPPRSASRYSPATTTRISPTRR